MNTPVAVLLTVFALCSFKVAVSAQDADPAGAVKLSFTRLSPTDGLSDANVTSILQDHQGFMWMGTQVGGLNRYDGYEFKTYRNDLKDPGRLGSDQIWSMYRDRHDTLWIASHGGGLVQYDQRADKFIRHLADADNPDSVPQRSVRTIYEDSAGAIWVGGAQGFSKFDRETGKFKSYQIDPADNSSSPGLTVLSIREDRMTGLLWVAHQKKGVGLFDKTKQEFVQHYRFEADNPRSLSDDLVRFVYQDRMGDIWLATPKGVNRFNWESETFTRYAHDPLQEGSVSHNQITQILEDRSGRLWVSTLEGLNLFDRESDRFSVYLNDPSDPNSLSDSFVRSIYEDDMGALWFGTRNGGVNRLDPEPERFTSYRSHQSNPNSLSSNVVRSLFVDRGGELWIGTQDGLNHFDGENFTAYRHDPKDPNSLGSDVITHVCEDPRGGLWIGTNGGLNHFDGNQFTRYNHDPEDPDSLSGQQVSWICPDDKGGLWVAILGFGIDYFDGSKFVNYRPNTNRSNGLTRSFIFQIIKDRNKDVFWLCSGADDITRLDANERKFTPIPYVTSSGRTNVQTLYQSKDGFIWVGSLEGLGLFDPENEQLLRLYTTADGLADNSVSGIMEDERGHLWVSTHKGLSQFNPLSDSFSNYDAADGLASDQFERRAVARNPGGYIFLGGPEGVSAFHPKRLSDNPTPPRIVLTGLTQAGTPLELASAPNLIQEVQLDWMNNHFEFKFAALNFKAPEKNQYAYKLEGWDEEWYDAGANPFGRYSGLANGDYTLRLRGSNNDGVWNEEGASISIVVTPPFWKTYWFYAFAFVAIVVSGYSYIRFRERKLKQERIKLTKMVEVKTKALLDNQKELEAHREQLEETVEKRTEELVESRDRAEAALFHAKESDRLKSQFLANFSHEIRTPLNAITGFCTLINEPDIDARERAQFSNIISENSDSLLSLIDDIMDISMIAADQMKIEPNAFSLNEFIDYIYSSCKLRESNKRIAHRLNNTLVKEELSIEGDRFRIKQVIDNLMTNAFKFTTSGFVELGVYKKSDAICFYVEDSGPGIPSEELELIFQRFVKRQVDDLAARRGVGLGLAISRRLSILMEGDLSVESQIGKGSTFTLSLPLRLTQPLEPPRKVIQSTIEKGKRILVVEDEPANYKYVEICLRKMGMEIVWAEDGFAGVAAVGNDPAFDLVLLDIKMPGIDGFETLKRIRSIDSGIKVIAQTACAMKNDENRIHQAGFNGYLSKPIKMEALTSLVEESLRSNN